MKATIKERGNGLRGRCTCKRVGNGVLSNLGSLLKKTGRSLLNSGKRVLPSVVKQVAPTLITAATAKLSERASKAGVPDSVVNLGNQLAQRGARELTKGANQGLSTGERSAASFISDQSMNMLSQLLNKSGSGVRNLGQGRGLLVGAPRTADRSQLRV